MLVPLQYPFDPRHFNNLSQVIGFRTPREIDFRISSSIDGVYNFFLSGLEKIGENRNENFYIHKTRSSMPPTEECNLSKDHEKEIREIMKKNVSKKQDDKEMIKIVFSYCKGDSGIKLVEDYKKALTSAVEKYGKLTTKQKEDGDKVMFNPGKPNENEIVAKKDQEAKKKENWEFVKKYNKTDSNITKIKVYLNNDEYKEIPYQGTITDDYHKILFTSSFDIFPTKKLKIKN